jgi:hypothetical protein
MTEMTHQVADRNKSALTAKDFYDQGSKCCQQYSQLTMQVRTLAQQVMIAYAVGIGVFIARGENLSASYSRLVMSGTGIILIIFGVVLCLLNLHHSDAFRAIRDECLVPLEAENRLTPSGKGELIGPWQAHQTERTDHSFKSGLAWYAPFIALWFIGSLSFVAGMWLLPR